MELNKILAGDCIEVMPKLPENIANVIFADPPYNLQLSTPLYRPNCKKVAAVTDEWDKFASFGEYDLFTYNWLKACRRILKDTGTIWVVGSYHNIYRVGKTMTDLGFWLLNDIIWLKNNPMPNFHGVRFTNAHEILLWAQKSKQQKEYTFNYHTMKLLNDDLQMRSDWYIPLCTGKERCRLNGQKAHPTQKPEALLRRVIMSSSNVGDVILDPFFGTGTTGAVAKQLNRNWLGIEKNPAYVEVAANRIQNTAQITANNTLLETPSKRNIPKVTLGNLLEAGLLAVGQKLYSKDLLHSAIVYADSSLSTDSSRGSIHKLAAHIKNTPSCNGWEYWHYQIGDCYRPIDELRGFYRRQFGQTAHLDTTEHCF